MLVSLLESVANGTGGAWICWEYKGRSAVSQRIATVKPMALNKNEILATPGEPVPDE